jgi:hypothetical protein
MPSSRIPGAATEARRGDRRRDEWWQSSRRSRRRARHGQRDPRWPTTARDRGRGATGEHRAHPCDPVRSVGRAARSCSPGRRASGSPRLDAVRCPRSAGIADHGGAQQRREVGPAGPELSDNGRRVTHQLCPPNPGVGPSPSRGGKEGRDRVGGVGRDPSAAPRRGGGDQGDHPPAGVGPQHGALDVALR